MNAVQVHHPEERLVLGVWGGKGEKGMVRIQQEENTGKQFHFFPGKALTL